MLLQKRETNFLLILKSGDLSFRLTKKSGMWDKIVVSEMYEQT